MKCKICETPTRKLFVGEILLKYQVQFFRCTHCEFIQAEEPYWLKEAYSSAISDLDLGPINRAMSGSGLIEGLILAFFDFDASFVDWGGGYGVFTRLMRDRGYDFYWRDLYCENLFAKQFVAREDTSYEMLTAFEVFEHLVDPLAEIQTMLKYSDNIAFSTLLAPDSITDIKDWWYFTPEHGQHISLFTLKSLQVIAQKFDLNFYSDGAAMHLLTRKRISQKLFRVLAKNGRAAQMARRVMRHKLRKHSLLWDDFRAVTGWNV